MSGSKTAKGGFQNEHEIVELINAGDAKLVREIGRKTNSVSKSAHKVAGSPKTDIKVFHDKGSHNISVKKFDTGNSYNHLARTSPKSFCEQNGLSDATCNVLSVFTGFSPPSEHKDMLKEGVDCDTRRVFMSDIKESYSGAALKELQQKKDEIALWAFSGSEDEIDFFIFSENDKGSGSKKHRCFSKEEVLKYYNTATPMQITKRGSISFGNSITIQRKGGSGSPTNIQLKFKPHYLHKK